MKDDDDYFDLMVSEFYSRGAKTSCQSSGIPSSANQTAASKSRHGYVPHINKGQTLGVVSNNDDKSAISFNAPSNNTPIVREVAYASVRGQGHIDANIPCEDASYAAYSADRNVVVGCVCDGAGSYPFTRIGANETSKVVVSFLVQHFDRFLQNPDWGKRELLNQIHRSLDPKSEIFQNHQERLFEQIERQIRNVASVGNKIDLQQFKEQVVRQFVVPIIDGAQLGVNDDYRKFVNEFWRGYLQSQAKAQTDEFILRLNNLVNPDQVLDLMKEYFENRTNIWGRNLFACTVVAFAIHKNGDWVAVHIGDGGIIGRDQDGDLKIISLPENGEYANETYFVTQDDAIQHIRVVHSLDPRAPYGICDALLFSDGPEYSLLRRQTPNNACNAFLDQPFFYLEKFGAPNVKMEVLIEHNLIPQTEDDCTLLAIRTSREDDPPPQITSKSKPKPRQGGNIGTSKRSSSVYKHTGVAHQDSENDDNYVLLKKFVFFLSIFVALLLGVALGMRLNPLKARNGDRRQPTRANAKNMNTQQPSDTPPGNANPAKSQQTDAGSEIRDQNALPPSNTSPGNANPATSQQTDAGAEIGDQNALQSQATPDNLKEIRPAGNQPSVGAEGDLRPNGTNPKAGRNAKTLDSDEAQPSIPPFPSSNNIYGKTPSNRRIPIQPFLVVSLITYENLLSTGNGEKLSNRSRNGREKKSTALPSRDKPSVFRRADWT